MTPRTIPTELHAQIRIGVLSALISEEKDFSALREITGATDGNLSIHLKKLEDGGYITVEKLIVNRKTRSIYSLTKYGLGKYIEYVQMLNENLDLMKE